MGELDGEIDREAGEYPNAAEAVEEEEEAEPSADGDGEAEG